MHSGADHIAIAFAVCEPDGEPDNLSEYDCPLGVADNRKPYITPNADPNDVANDVALTEPLRFTLGFTDKRAVRLANAQPNDVANAVALAEPLAEPLTLADGVAN